MKTLQNTISWFWKEFLYEGHLQCLGALSVIFISSLVLKIPLSWDIFLVTYLIFYPVYIYNRVRETTVDALTNSQRTQHVINSKKILWPLFWTCVIGALFLLVAFSNFKGILFGIFIFVFGILYTEFFKKLTRYIMGFKNFYVAAVFALFVFFPNLYYGSSFSPSFWKEAGILVLFIFLKNIVWQIFLDIKDIESDEQERLRTFPILLRRKRIFCILPLLGITATVPVFFLPHQFLSLFLVLPFNWYTYSLAKKGSYNGYTLASFEMIFWAIILLFVQKLT